MFCFCPSFLTSNFAQGTLANATKAQISRYRNNYDLYYIILEWRLVDPSPSLPPLAQTSSYATARSPRCYSYWFCFIELTYFIASKNNRSNKQQMLHYMIRTTFQGQNIIKTRICGPWTWNVPVLHFVKNFWSPYFNLLTV